MEGSLKKIEHFSSNRPNAVGVFGYGSAVFRQNSYGENSNPLTDVIFVVDDLKKWHKKNKRLNPNDYSFLGSIFVSYSSIKRMKGQNNITYFGEVKDSGFMFKYGVIEVNDFIQSLSTWDNMFMAGRFHKPVLKVKTNTDLDECISKNRMTAIRIACLLSGSVVTRRELLVTLCGISYLGDVRMKIAENPHKVENIVDGSFETLSCIYSMDQEFLFPLNKDTFLISHEVLLREIDELPEGMLNYLISENVDLTDISMVSEYILKYINERNQIESRAQIVEGLKTNGIARSFPYVKSKIMKKINGS